MSAYSIELIEATTDLQQSIDRLVTVMPLIEEWWKEEGRAIHQVDLSVHMQLLIDMWIKGGLRILRVDLNEKPHGLVILALFRPMLYDRSVATFPVVFLRDSPSRAMMTDYLGRVLAVLGVNELWWGDGTKPLDIAGWSQYATINETRMRRG